VRRFIFVIALIVALSSAPSARAGQLTFDASPNPASVGQRVVHTIGVGVSGRLDVWVSAQGFGKPRLGTLPSGSWSWRCCPSQTAGTPAWHFRSSSTVPPDTYRFGADARQRGAYLSTATVGIVSATVWIRIA
jgi:hypothetical protein